MSLKINTIKSHISPLFDFPNPKQRPYWFYLTTFFLPLFVSCAFSTHWMLVKQWLLPYYPGAIQPRAASVAVNQWKPTGLPGKCANSKLLSPPQKKACLISGYWAQSSILPEGKARRHIFSINRKMQSRIYSFRIPFKIIIDIDVEDIMWMEKFIVIWEYEILKS